MTLQGSGHTQPPWSLRHRFSGVNWIFHLLLSCHQARSDTETVQLPSARWERMKVNRGTAGRDAAGSRTFELHIPEPTTTKAPKRKGQTHEVLFVFTETSSLPLNTRLTSNGINYHVSARNLTQEMKEGHNLPRGVAGGQRGPGR